MRIRSIKPEFWRSPDVSRLNIEDRLLFIGMWSYVDDNGVGEDRVSMIAADLFADDVERDPREAFARVSRGLANLSEGGQIIRYEVAGRKYLEVAQWSSHQRIDKPARSKLPRHSAEGAVLATPSRHSREAPAITLGTDQGIKGSRERGNEGTREPTPAARVTESDFEAAYLHWPKKAEKKKSYDKFVRLIESGVRDLETLTADIIRFGDAYRAYSEKQYTPALVVWLNGERWTDDLPEPRQARSTPPSQSRAEQNLTAYWKEFGDDASGGMAAIGS